jgi:acetate kinase
MGGLDSLVFTGGIGENATKVRELICEEMQYLGIEIDKDKNVSTLGKEDDISSRDSRVKVFVIPTNEELVIARDTLKIMEEVS